MDGRPQADVPQAVYRIPDSAWEIEALHQHASHPRPPKLLSHTRYVEP